MQRVRVLKYERKCVILSDIVTLGHTQSQILDRSVLHEVERIGLEQTAPLQHNAVDCRSGSYNGMMTNGNDKSRQTKKIVGAIEALLAWKRKGWIH